MLGRFPMLCLRAMVAMLFAFSVDLAGASPVANRPAGVKTLYYSDGVMSRVARCHMTPGCGVGNYVPSMRLRSDRTCLTAVNYNSRWMLGANVIIVARFWNPRTQRWGPVERCQAADYQQRRHSTGSVQRLELDYATALRNGFVRDGTTVAQILRIER